MYDLAMTIYFGMYGATMTTNSELFWGPDSIMMLPARRCVESNFGRPMPSTRRCPCHDHLTHCLISTQYMSATGDAQSAFFQRMTGLGFAIMSLGYAKCGVSKDAWIKQTMIFHVISTPIFFLQCASDDGTSFTPWVWYRALRRRGGCLHFPRHRRDVPPRSRPFLSGPRRWRHHVSVRSPNRHQHRARRLGLH